MEQWQIRNDPVGALDHYAAAAEEFDRRWSVMHDETKTIGERMREMRVLAMEILTTHGVVTPKGK